MQKLWPPKTTLAYARSGQRLLSLRNAMQFI